MNCCGYDQCDVHEVVELFELKKALRSQVRDMKKKLGKTKTTKEIEEIKEDLEHLFGKDELANMSLEKMKELVFGLAKNPVELAMKLHFGSDQLYGGAGRKSTFCTGEKQRIALARAFLQHRTTPPMVAIFDESFSGLHQEMFEKIYGYIRNKWKDSIFIIASHNLEHMKYISGRATKDMKMFELLCDVTEKGNMYHFRIGEVDEDVEETMDD